MSSKNKIEKLDITSINQDNTGSSSPPSSAFTGFVGSGFKPIDQLNNNNNSQPTSIFTTPNFDKKKAINNRLSKLVDSESYFSKREKQAFLASLVSQARKTKKEIIETVDSVRDMYIVGAILEIFDEEATAKSNDAFNLIDISSSNSNIDRYAKAFQREIDIDALVGSLTEDLCAYGEYILRVNPDPNNFQVFDDVIQSDVVAVYKSSQLFPEYFLSGLVRSNFSDAELTKKASINYVHFCLGKRKIKIIVNARDLSGVRITKYPYYVRIGKSLIYNVLDKLKQLDLLEKLTPMTYLNSLSGSNLIGIQVPSSMDPKTVLETTKKYEKILNTLFDLTTLYHTDGSVNTEQLILSASKYKVIPLWGDKGSLDRVDVGQSVDANSSSNIADTIDDTRNSILTTIGVPGDLFNGGNSRAESLKQYTRFVRKLIMIQQAIKSGVMQLFIIYLSAHGISANPQEINIKLTNTLIDVTQFDRLEATDMVATIVKNIIDMYSSVQDFLNAADDENSIYDRKRLLTQISNILGSTGFSETLKITQNEDKSNLEEISNNGSDNESQSNDTVENTDNINNQNQLDNSNDNDSNDAELVDVSDNNSSDKLTNETDTVELNPDINNEEEPPEIPDKEAPNGDLLL